MCRRLHNGLEGSWQQGKAVGMGTLAGEGAGQGCIRREGTSEAAPAAVRKAVGGGCRSGWGRLLSVINAIEAGLCRQGDSGWAYAGRPGGGGGGAPPRLSNASVGQTPFPSSAPLPVPFCHPPQVAIQAFATLTEFCQGPCPGNQKALVACNVTADVNKVLEFPFEKRDTKLAFELRCMSTLSLLSLLEGCNDATYIPQLMVCWPPVQQTPWDRVAQCRRGGGGGGDCIDCTWNATLCCSSRPKGAYGTTDEAFILILHVCLSPPDSNSNDSIRGGGMEVRRFPQFFWSFFRDCLLLVPLACVWVPCVSPVQRCCSVRLRGVWHIPRNYSAISRNFSQLDLDLTLPDRNPPPPPLRPSPCALPPPPRSVVEHAADAQAEPISIPGNADPPPRGCRQRLGSHPAASGRVNTATLPEA